MSFGSRAAIRSCLAVAGEEIESLRAAGLPVKIIPGVTAACAAAANSAIPLTHRDSPALHLVTGHGSDGAVPSLDW